MKFLFIYQGGDVPEHESRQNIDQLWEWLGSLKHQGDRVTTFMANGGNSVSRDSVSAYKGRVFGVSIIEAESMDAALALTQDWPELRYGGRIEILKEL